VSNSDNIVPTTTTAEQTDIFGGETSDDTVLAAPSPVVEQIDIYDDQPSSEAVATESTDVDSDLFAGSNSNTEAPLSSAQAESSNTEAPFSAAQAESSNNDPFNEETTATPEASNAFDSDVLDNSNAQPDVVEYHVDQKEEPRELPPTVEEIVTSSSENSETG
jgi:hypothetical protein